MEVFNGFLYILIFLLRKLSLHSHLPDRYFGMNRIHWVIPSVKGETGVFLLRGSAGLSIENTYLTPSAAFENLFSWNTSTINVSYMVQFFSASQTQSTQGRQSIGKKLGMLFSLPSSHPHAPEKNNWSSWHFSSFLHWYNNGFGSGFLAVENTAKISQHSEAFPNWVLLLAKWAGSSVLVFEAPNTYLLQSSFQFTVFLPRKLVSIWRWHLI